VGGAGPLTVWDDVEVRRVHPFEAVKRYTCPGCHGDIRPGVGHVVVVPRETPDLRRHWHGPCWERRGRTRGWRTSR
jgi:hypothetical protein